MPGFMPGIHVFSSLLQNVDGRDIGVRSTPFFERLCPAMTNERRCRVALDPRISVLLFAFGAGFALARDNGALLHLGAPESDHLFAEFPVGMAAADQRAPGCDPAFPGRFGSRFGPPFGHHAASGFAASHASFSSFSR